MLSGINQKTERLLRPIQDYGCLFLCFAQSSPEVFTGDKGAQALNAIWNELTAGGVIKENVIQDHDSVARRFSINLRYDGIHHDAKEEIPANVKMVFGKYKWKYEHFVILDREKNVAYDSLGKSFTVMNGALKSMRWYYAD
jgi:Protein of unknown function, DUF261.